VNIQLRRAALPIVLVVTALGAAGCSSGHSSTSKSAVTIKNFAFAPSPASATAGQPLQVRNADDTAHTFTADDGSFDTGPIAGGQTRAITPRAPGTIHYHCSIHTYMTGTLSVSR